jgi:hypothetical protein
MALIVLIISYILILLTIGTYYKFKLKYFELIIITTLIFSFILLMITEITSFFRVLNYSYLLYSWCLISSICIVYLYGKKNHFFIFLKFHNQTLHEMLKELNKIELSLFYSSCFLLILTFIQGLLYPPNNWDSMTYHLARIPHWISQQSVEHYQTHIVRQLYQLPFSEFILLNINVLSKSDLFSNSIQLFYLIFSIVAIVTIVDLLGFNRKFKFIAIILSLSIPELMLQASSTQNDIILSFFILASFYFAVKSIREVNIFNFFYLGLSIGLAILTKGTAYIYLAPLVIIFYSRCYLQVI